MATVKDIASYLIYAYEKMTESKFEDGELKLQKLIYFAQRESIALTGEKLFNENIYGWVHGPVVEELRFFLEDNYEPYEEDKLNVKEKYVIDNVLAQYSHYSAWYLRNLSHEEKCWKKARKGLLDNQPGYERIKDEDIFEDAKKVRIYDNLYDMYIDEFEDLNAEDLKYVLC